MKTDYLSDADKQAIDELKLILDKKLSSYTVTLFGSKARGESEEFSDIDLLIITERDMDTKFIREIIYDAYYIELKYEVLFGLVFYNEKKWNEMKDWTFAKNIQKDGVLV